MTEIIIILAVTIFISNLLLVKAYFSIKVDYKLYFDELNISLVIPFKNEKDNLPNLLSSLSKLDYNPTKFEIIFVNDNSTDGSDILVKNYSLNNSTIINANEKNLPGKKGALEIGIKQSKFDIIAITDADCLLESDWLKSISKKISQGYDLVFGYSPLITNKSLISKVSAYENLRNYILYILLAQLKIPFGATARSIAFKKSTYDEVSGYSNTTETLSGDDDLFIRECLKNNFKIGFFLDNNSYVYSYPSESFKEYFKRKSRHTKTSHYYLIKHKIILGIWYSVNALSSFIIFLSPLSIYFSIPFFTKIFFDLLILRQLRKKIYHDFNFIEIIYLEFMYQVFVVINFINSFLLKDEWNKT